MSSTLQSRSFLSALNTTSLKTGLLNIKQAAQSRLLKSGTSVKAPIEFKAQSHIRSQTQALLNISDSQSMLTTVEDSLETILDVLSEMKTLAAEAGAIHDGTVYENEDARGAQGWINGSRSLGGMTALRTAYGDRLTDLSREIDEIVQDTTYFGKPLLGDEASSISIFVDPSQRDTLDVSIEPLSAAILNLAADDIRVFNNDAAAATFHNISDAMTSVRERMNQVVSIKDRLSIKFENVTTSRSIHSASIAKVDDDDSARRQLERAKLQIVEESNLALLAQANAVTNSALQLATAVHRDNDGGPIARIYSIDHDRDSAPVTHLRRIMLGQTFEQPADSTFSKLDA